MNEYDAKALRAELGETQRSLYSLQAHVEQLTHVLREVLQALTHLASEKGQADE